MDVIKIRGGQTYGRAIRFRGRGFIGVGWSWLAFEIGFEIFKHEVDSNGFAIYLGPAYLFIGWLKSEKK